MAAADGAMPLAAPRYDTARALGQPHPVVLLLLVRTEVH